VLLQYNGHRVGIPEDKLDTLFAIDHAKSTEGTRGEPRNRPWPLNL